MKKRILIVTIGLGLSISLIACGKTAEDVNSSVINETEDNSDAEDTIAVEDEQSSEESASINKDESFYIDRLVSEAGVSEEEILSVNVYPYEGKDLYSAFIFVGSKDEEWDTYFGTLWFVTDEKVEKIHNSENGYYSTGDVLSFSNTDKAFFYINEYYVTQAVSYVYGVENGDIYEAPISAYGEVYRKDTSSDDFIITVSAYDNYISSDDDFPIGHTWKPYYFFYDDEKDSFAEYVGMPIDSDRLEEVCDEDILGEIANMDASILDIYERPNGIITVNYRHTDYYDGGSYEITYGNVNYDINKKSYVDVWSVGTYSLENSDYGGTYQAALMPCLMYEEGMDDDTIYDKFIEGELIDASGRYCAYAKNSPDIEYIEDLEWARYDIDNDGVNELFPRLYGSYTVYGYTIRCGCVYPISFDGCVFGSEGGFFNTKNQFVGTDVTHANRNQYLISEYDELGSFKNVLFFSKWWADEENMDDCTYEKYIGDFWQEGGAIDFVQITEEEYNSLCEEYLVPNENITFSK